MRDWLKDQNNTLTPAVPVGGGGVCVGERSTPQWVANGYIATEAVRHDCVPVVSPVSCVSVQDALEKTVTIDEKRKSSRLWCCLFWVLTHALLSFSSASHVFAHSSHTLIRWAARKKLRAVVCLWLQGRCVCLLSPLSIPASSLTPSLLSSIRPSVYPSVNQSSVPLSIILSFLFYVKLHAGAVFPSSLCSCNCEFCKLALWKAVPLKELHINVTLPHAFTWFNISRTGLVFWTMFDLQFLSPVVCDFMYRFRRDKHPCLLQRWECVFSRRDLCFLMNYLLIYL